MIDRAGIRIAQGQPISCERIESVNDNMSKSHYHNFFELYYLETGERYHIIQDSAYHITAGQLVIFPPYVMHHSYGEKNVSFKRIILYFQPSEIQYPALLEELKKSGGIYSIPDKDARRQIHHILEMILLEEKSQNSLKLEAMQSLLNFLLINFFRQASQTHVSSSQTLIGQFIDYIHNHYNEDLSLDFLAHKFFISPYYLCREFKHYTNRPFSQYVNITRIMNAQRKLIETDKSITEISTLTGFSNLTHFNRVFKQYTDITPSQYRKLSKNAAIPSP